MKKLILVIGTLLTLAMAAAAQSGTNGSKNEFFAGYSYNSADVTSLENNRRTGQNGVALSYTRYLGEHVGVILDVSGHFSRESGTIGNATLKKDLDQYFAMGGVQYRGSAHGRLSAFAHVMGGAAGFRSSVSSLTPAANVYTFDDGIAPAIAIGGGLDVRVGRRVAVRVIQADYIPAFYGRGRQDNVRLSFGVVFR